MAVAAVVLAGCSSAPSSSGPTTPTTTSGAPGTTTSTTQAPGSEPVLGRPAGIYATAGQGFGKVRPTEVSNGGDPTGTVTGITWSSWGGTQATGSGTSEYVAPNQSTANGTEETATIVAFDRGTCAGQDMYQAVEWYFPSQGQSFNPNQFEDVCTGQPYPPETGSYTDGSSAPYFQIVLAGSPNSLSGAVHAVESTETTTLFAFSGTASIDGSLKLLSSGPNLSGQTVTGSWQSGTIVLDNCSHYLVTSSGGSGSCTFNWTGS
jgi:hypothetical protein